MAHANIDELRFFLDGREELAPHVQAVGATVTDLMQAISAQEYARVMQQPDHVQEVCVLLEDANIQELDDDDLELVEAAD